jgi:hypothetical protein
MGGAHMRCSNWVLPGFSLLFCGTVAFSATGPAPRPQIAERIKIQEARVPEIEAVAAREREQAEQWYRSRRAATVQEIARREAARFSIAERDVWVQYWDMYRDRFYAPAYFEPAFPAVRPMAKLAQAMRGEYLISEMAELLASEEFEQKLTQIVEERLEVWRPNTSYGNWQPPSYLPLLQRWAEELLIVVKNVRSQLALELTQLDNQRKARLDAIMEWENDVREQVRGILEYLRQSESRPVQFGVVESVGYCPQGGYFCLIEGVDRPLGIGDTVGKVRIVKIDQEKVEFAKNGTMWAQQLGAAPQPYWD